MSAIKLTAIFLITAIINPLCCCLDLSAEDLETASAAEHSCCSTAPDPTNADAKGHTQADCPHASDKNSQISESPYSHDSGVKSQISQQAILYVLDFPQRDSARETTSRYQKNSSCLIPETPVPEEYCVYIL